MDRPPLDVSPVAKFLIGLVEQRASGIVELPPRALQLVTGDVVDVSAAPEDPDLGEFALRSGRITAKELQRARERSSLGDLNIERALLADTRVGASELRPLKRSLWLDRLIRSLRANFAAPGGGTRPRLTPLGARAKTSPDESAADGGDTVRFLPLILDALSRIALDSDAASVGMRLNHRLAWIELPLTAEAQRWASLGESAERPVVSAILARLPASAPQLAALVRAGFARLEVPGRISLRKLSRTETLPPPAPRLSSLPELPPRPTPRPERPKPNPRDEPGPRLQLDPGASGVPIETIPRLTPPAWPRDRQPLADPLREIELALPAPEAMQLEHAARLLALAELWENRIGSLEEACRARREAAAVCPDDPALLERCADDCFRLGQAELAVRYAAAALALSSQPADRGRRHRKIARYEQARGQLEAAIAALSEASAEYPSDPAPHEALVQILAERDQLPLAAAHARLAARLHAPHDPQRALALLALAFGWHPIDPLLTGEYADRLESLGHPEAAVAIEAEAARNALSAGQRRALLEQAAERAERLRRSDLRSELLLEIFDREPRYEPIHAALSASLDRRGLEAEHAALLESIARNCRPVHRAEALAHCADALARLPGERHSSLRYLWLARELDPDSLAPPQHGLLANVPVAEQETWQRDPRAMIAELERQLSAQGDDSPLLARLCALRVEQGDLRGIVSACLRLLAREPEHALAAARLWRATAELNDPMLRQEALTLLARLRQGRDQGRAFALLARLQEDILDYDSALANAQSALERDPVAADAALIVLRHVHRLEPARALALLERASSLLGAPPAALSSIAEAASAASDPSAQERALQALSSRLPSLLQPRLLALDALLGLEDPDALGAAAQSLLSHCSGPEVTERVRAAVERLVELDDSSQALLLAELSLQCRGELDPPYADRSVALARKRGDRSQIARALERAASVHGGSKRAECLFALAAQHEAQGDRVAELHALLRAVAIPEGRARALPVLAERFAANGDGNRLLTALTLQLEAASAPEPRRKLLFDLASAALSYAGDREAARGYLTLLFQESAADRVGLLFGLGALFTLFEPADGYALAREIADGLDEPSAAAIYLWLARKAELDDDRALALDLAGAGARRFSNTGELLLLAERLSLATRAKQTAMALYADLVALAMGQHGQRALHYRAGRWLERAGEAAEAAEYYALAFELAPGAGVAFSALERTARDAQQPNLLVDAQLKLAASQPDQEARATLFEAAARTSLLQLRDPVRAIRILAGAEVGVAAGRLDLALNEAARQLSSSAPDQARHSLRVVANARGVRAAQLWDGEGKAELLLSLGRLQLTAVDDPNAALEPFEQVLTSELRTSLDTETLANGLIDYAQALERCDRNDEADAARSEARLLAPELARVRVPYSSQPARPREPSAPAIAPPQAANWQGLAPEGDSEVEARLREEADAGDPEALAELIECVALEPSRQAEAHALLGQLVRLAPERSSALRQLYDQALELGAAAEARVAAQILALFEPEVAPPSRISFRSSDLGPQELDEIIRDGMNAGLSELLHLAWRHAQTLPRYRREPQPDQLGDRVPPDEVTPLARAHARASFMLGRKEAQLYVTGGTLVDVDVVPSQPPAIVARAGLPPTLAVEFLIARSLSHVAPEHALLCALPEVDGRELWRALLAAFGAPSTTGPLTLSRREKEIAAELWATLPKRGQTELQGLIESHTPDELDFETLRAAAQACALRAGLFVESDAGRVLATLAETEVDLNGCDITSEAGYQLACQRSEAFREIIRTALSLPFVGLTALTLESPD